MGATQLAGEKITRYKLNSASFTLVEIVVVIAIISIITAISIPNINRMRINANEHAVISALKNLHTALEAYHDIYNKYPVTDGNLQPNNLATANFTPSVLMTKCDKTIATPYYGYVFCYSYSTASDTYTYHANPFVNNQTGVRVFILDQTGAILQCYNPTNCSPLAGN